MITYTTLTYLGVEKTLADWGINTWSRSVQNQADDNFSFTMPTPMDGSDIFPYGANVIIKINRIASAANPTNPTLPVSVLQVPSVTFTGGTQWFWGYCVDNDRTGDPGSEFFNYKFVGPYQFFFARLIFQKLQLTWNGVKQIADYQSDVILGLSLTTLTGTGDTVQGTTATNLMSIAQQVKEIAMYAQADSAYQQGINGLNWPATAVAGQPVNAQFRCDQLTHTIDGINYDLLQNPSANVLINDYAGTALTGKTSASALPAGSYILRPPLDACNAITCKDAMQRMLQWLGGIGAPVVWTDHSQTPPQLKIGAKNLLPTKSLALSGITVKTKIKKRSDLIPAAVHFKYKISGSVQGQPYTIVINDVAAYLTATGAPGVPGTAGVSLYEGIGQLGALYNLTSPASQFSNAIQNGLMAAAKTASAIVQTLDFVGDKVNAATAKITTMPVNLVDPQGSGPSTAFWQYLFPELKNCSNVQFFSPAYQQPVVTDVTTGQVYYTTGGWTGTVFGNMLVDGQIAPWMLNGGTPANPTAGNTVKVQIKAHFSYNENLSGQHTVAGSAVGSHEKTATVTLTTLPTGTYSSAPYGSAGEPIPYGLAGSILAIESIPQYEGSITVQETEISDVCPIGRVLNITGGLAAWATMAATVQSVRYSDNGQTEISFGPAKHLNAAQFVQRFRNNIGPRWYNLIGGDPMNQSNPGPGALGNNIPALAPSPGAKMETFKSFFTNLLSTQTPATAPTLPGGVHVDSGAAASPFTGAVPAGTQAFAQGAAIIIANGPQGVNSGESQAWIRISLADLQGQNKQIYLQELPVCVNVGGTLTAMFQLFLCSQPYANSIF